MSCSPVTVEQWKRQNAHRLIDCRWGCSITPEACREYQSRTSRHIIHFNGTKTPLPRVNADYLRCVYPEPCPHLLCEEEVAAGQARKDLHSDVKLVERRSRFGQGVERDRLVNPRHMLREPNWNRSLVKR